MYTRIKKFIFLTILLTVLFFLVSAFINEVTKVNPYEKSSRISCQKKTTTFERVYIKEDIQNAKDQVQSGNFEVTSSILKSVYMKSKLFDYVKLADTDRVVYETLNLHVKNKVEQKEKLNIAYYIYENDINDPGKKTEKSKIYAGYVVFRFYNHLNECIYQVQVDFMDKKGNDLAQSIQCAIKSFITI